MSTDSATDGAAWQPVVGQSLPGSARGWELPADRCLTPGGRYAWSLRALGVDGEGEWSEAALFEVAAAPSIEEVEEALDVLRRYAESELAAAERLEGVSGTDQKNRTQELGRITSLVDTVIDDDLIVEGSICMADNDSCASGESFNGPSGLISELKVKDTNGSLIWFDDDNGDWELGDNGTGSFVLMDASIQTVFKAEQSAPADLMLLNGAGVTINGDFRVSSSRTRKEGFAPVDASLVLERLAALPIYEWSFREDPTGSRHIGPVAEEFHAAFPLDEEHTEHISINDMNGVTLAALQALHQRLERLEEETRPPAADDVAPGARASAGAGAGKTRTLRATRH